MFAGTPPLAFTFGLGAELVFPLRFGASTAILRGSKPEQILDGIARFRSDAHVHGSDGVSRAAGAWRSGAPQSRTWISAGEHLPKATSDAWHAATGQRIVDGIGATEMIHIFVSASGATFAPARLACRCPAIARAFSTKGIARCPADTPGRLAVRGPTGCRYLADPRQTNTSSAAGTSPATLTRWMTRGYLWYQARTDDMIVSAGYNIAGPEIEAVLLEHPAVAECAVVGVPDADRGQIVKAVVVLRDPPQSAAD